MRPPVTSATGVSHSFLFPSPPCLRSVKRPVLLQAENRSPLSERAGHPQLVACPSPTSQLPWSWVS